jgi:hypothetical protein
VATILESFAIHSPEFGKPFNIDLIEDLDAAHIDFIENNWRPILLRQHNLAMLEFFSLPSASQTDDKWNETSAKYGAPDARWDWQQKCAIAAASSRKSYALLSAGQVEAVMLLHFGKTSRGPGSGLPIVYVDFIAVGPWSRAPIQTPQRFRGLGTVLMGSAVKTSLAMRRNGVCGLHSLPQSEGFYRRLGMTDFDIDTSYESLRYFEYSVQAAADFLAKGCI